MSKTIIIGAGIAGIATAIRLSVKGHQVQVLEANSYPGGKLSSFTQEGYRFDAGPSLFTLPHLVTELFELCGEDASAHFKYTKQAHACHYFWNDGTTFEMPGDKEKIAPAISKQFGTPVKQVQAYLDRSAMKYESTKSIFLEKSLHKLSTYFSLETLKALFHASKLNLFQSLHEVNKHAFKNPKLIQLFDRFATYNGSNPYQTPGIMSMIPHLEMGIGTFFPEGGMQSITNSLVDLAKRQGVSFQFESPVEELIIEGNRVLGARVSGQVYKADQFISNMDIFSTYKRLLPQSKHPERILNQERSSSALIFYWGVKLQTPALSLHNILFSDHYEEEFDFIFNKKEVHPDPTVYINISSKCEESDAPGQSENWFVMINTPGDFGQDWTSIIDRARNNIQSKIKDVLGIDIENYIETEAILDPRSIEEKTQSHLGALYGTASNNRYAAFLRHANFSKQHKNLYFCGGSVHPGGGIPLCLKSAQIVSNLIAE
jgi:diapolycopene oxygenase